MRRGKKGNEINFNYDSFFFVIIYILLFGRCSPTMTFNVGLVICYCFVGLVHFVCAGPLDAALNWARADKLPIEIDVNLPWLPCKYHIHLTLNSFKIHFMAIFFFSFLVFVLNCFRFLSHFSRIYRRHMKFCNFFD